MEINLHGCTSIEMEEKSFDNFSVITVTIERENKEEVELQLFHAKDKNILFDFVDNFDMMVSEKSTGEVIKFKPCVAWREVV
jgi:hypothetical protein